jgi:hypothetical protein
MYGTNRGRVKVNTIAERLAKINKPFRRMETYNKFIHVSLQLYEKVLEVLYFGIHSNSTLHAPF